jgi:hypothetical protein
MVFSGVGGICVLLWGRVVPRCLCLVFCVINLTMAHGDCGKIHAGNSENFRVWRVFVTEFGILYFANTLVIF